ncbi:hypothetical protein HYDPIDRAFT_88197, partial [Hydnomerulius pinastri MD-312]
MAQTPPPSTSSNTSAEAQSHFWATYEREARSYDNELLEKYRSDMDIALIFAGLFSAVSTAFITLMSANLSPNPIDTTNTLLEILINSTTSTPITNNSNIYVTQWTGPSASAIWSQTLIFSSLSASLLAALGAVLGKQW